MPDSLSQRLRVLGPGLIMAAAGIGAGDVVIASVTGIRFGLTLLWAVALTAALKFILSEALARWQLATGETIARAWVTRLPRWVAAGFSLYLLFWTFMVGASLSSACGLAGASLFPDSFSVPVWGAIHAVAAALIVALNRYARFQVAMKLLVAVMALCVLGSAAIIRPAPGELFAGLLWPRLPAEGGGTAVLALLGGIGGSVTVICYGYWLRAEGWNGAAKLGAVRRDAGLAYLFTGLFGIALVIVAAGAPAHATSGTRIALEVAEQLRPVAGASGRWIFLLGFWCTVFTAMLGVWQGVPHIYVDVAAAWRSAGAETGRDRRIYLGALAWLAGPPLVLLWFRQPVGVVVAFSITGAFVLPFLAATLLWLNNRRDWMGALANRRLGNLGLALCLLLFGAVCLREILAVLTG